MLLTEQQSRILDMTRRFAEDKLAPNAAVWDREARFPAEALAEAGRLGLMGVTVPNEWDGAGADYVSMALVLEQIAKGDASTSTIMSGHNSVGCMPVLSYGNPTQKERFLKPMARGEMLSAFCLTEAIGGSDAGALKSRAIRDGSKYIITGEKQFITTGANAQVAIVFASTDPSRGSRGISAFLVPTDSPGYVVSRIEQKLGQCASDTAQISLQDIEVSADLRLGEEGEGYRIALSNLEGGRIGIAAQAVGIGQAALDCAYAYARERHVFGKAIIDHQAVGFRLAAMATRLEAARQLVLHAAALKDADAKCLKEACMAKLFASDTAEWVCSEAMQTLGGYGYLKDYPIERYFREVRVCRIYEGTNDIQNLVILREMQAGQ